MTTKLDKSYIAFVNDLKKQIKISRIKAHLFVNRELILLYFKIGKAILEKQREKKWGSKIVEQISKDLKKEFPNMTGLSRANIFYMRRFAEFYENELVQHPAGLILESPFLNIPWGHNILLMDQVSSHKKRFWYANQVINNGWSRNILLHQVKADLYGRQTTTNKTHNFNLTLPDEQSELVANLFKDKYNFEFLNGINLKEKEVEDCLVENIVQFLLELGRGFAFVGKQYNLEVGGQDFFIDLLFYNFELHCFIVIELKVGEFKPEYAGKLGFYLSVVDEKLKKDRDQNTIGIILCTKNNKDISKHSIHYMTKPIGISEYQISKKISDKKVKEIVPSIDEIANIKKTIS